MSIKIYQKFVPKDSISNIIDVYLNQWWLRFLTHVCIVTLASMSYRAKIKISCSLYCDSPLAPFLRRSNIVAKFVSSSMLQRMIYIQYHPASCHNLIESFSSYNMETGCHIKYHRWNDRAIIGGNTLVFYNSVFTIVSFKRPQTLLIVSMKFDLALVD